MKNIDSKEILEKAKRTVFLAGEEILKIYKTEIQVEIKADKEPVTKADIRSNEVLAGGLAGFGYPILSEEMKDDEGRLQESRVWIIDPMDGTRDFIDKTGDFSIMAALVEGGQPILGGSLQAHQPYLVLGAERRRSVQAKKQWRAGKA